MIWAFILRYNRAFIALGLILALFVALRLYVAGEVKQDRLGSRTEALEADAKADDVAGQVAASQTATVEKGNTDARNAANAGTDHLGDGLRSLRANKDRNGKAAR